MIAGIDNVLDAGTAAAFDIPHTPALGALRVARGTVHGRPVALVAIDRGAKRGAIGVKEARAVAAVFELLTTRPVPLVLLLESSGARMDMGLEMLAAFRRLVAAALAAQQRGVQSVAVVRSICYGGASMLAYLAQRRILTAVSRIAMSGPAVIAAMAGKDALDPDDAADVQALLGGGARAQLIEHDRFCIEDAQALRSALAGCLDELQAPGVDALARKHRALFERLGRFDIEPPRSPTPSPPWLKGRMDALFAEGFETAFVLGAQVELGVLVRGVRLRNKREITITGIVGGAPLSAAASWMLAESIITSARARPERPIVILYDSPGHAATRADEAVLLSDYLVHLAQTVQWAEQQGIAVSVWILGEASGGGYVTLTAACRSVVALPGADIRVLPRSAIASVIGDAPADEDDGPGRWLQLGLVDCVLQSDALTEAAVRAAGLP